MTANIDLKFTDASGTAIVVDLSSTNGKPVKFVPTAPALRTRSTSIAGMDGGDQAIADLENVTETVTAIMTGGTAAIRTAVQNLERLFNMARQYQKLKGVMPIWVKFRPDTSENWYRSQILSGRVIWDDEALTWQWRNGQITIKIVFTRRYYWEDDSETELALSIATGAASYATGGKTIYNHEDATAGHTNAVEIDTTAITGDLPASPRIELKNTNGSAIQYTKVYLSHEIEHVGAMSVVQEGESATGPASTADASSSGGYFGRTTWSGASETDLATWSNMNAAVLQNAAGKFFRAMIRFGNAPTYSDLWLRLKLTASSGTIWQSGKVLVSSAAQALQELVTLQLPPALIGSANLQTINVVLQATRTGGGSSTLDVDYIQHLALNGWRKYVPISGGVNQNETLVDDMISDYLYTLIGSAKLKHYTVAGRPILLEALPYKQRIRVLWQRSTGAAAVDDTMQVRMYYRARRKVL